MIKIELTKGQFQEIYDAVRDLPDEIREDLKIDGEEPDTAHLDLFSAVDELARIDKRLNKQFKQVKLNSPDWEWQLIMCHTLPRIGYKIPYNKNKQTKNKMIPETLPVHMSGDQLYNMVKLYDLLRDMSFELTPEQIEVFENIQDAEVNGGFF